MKAIIAFALCACAAIPALGFEPCDLGDKRKDLYNTLTRWGEAFNEKRYDDVDGALNAMIARHQQGALSDGLVERMLQRFESRELGNEPLHREWSESHPGSAAAHLAMAHYFAARGLLVREEASAKRPPTAQEAAMRRAFRESRLALDRADRLLQRRSLSAALRIRMAAAEGGAATAAAPYRQGLREDPASIAVRLRYIKANNPKWGGTTAKIASVLDDAATLSPGDRRYIEYLVHQELASAAEAGGDDVTAEREYATSEPLCPGLYVSATRLVELHLRNRNFPALVEVTGRLALREPESGWVFAMRARGERELDRYAEARADLERAIVRGYIPAFEALAWFYETGTGVARDPGKALELYAVGESRGSDTAREAAERLRSTMPKGAR